MRPIWRDLDRVGQARPVVVPLVIDEDLGLVFEPAERAAVDDAVAVALVGRTVVVLGLGMTPAPGWPGPIGHTRPSSGSVRVAGGTAVTRGGYKPPARSVNDQAWKLCPQPQEPVAFGLSILNPEPSRLSM